MQGTQAADMPGGGQAIKLPTGKETAAQLQQIYVRDYARLCAAACAVLHDAHAAQDAVQEAWLRLSEPRVLAGLCAGDDERLRHLVLITVRHTALNMRKRTAKACPLTDEEWGTQADPAPPPAEQAERRDAVSSLKAAMRQLGETDRSILLLQYDNGCTGRQIAALLGMKEAAVRKRSQRAKVQLKKILAEGGMQR